MSAIESKIKYENFMLEYEDYMIEEEYFESFYAYGPLTDCYWTAKPKILVCNLEPYDEREGNIKVDINLFKEWMKVNTGKFTAKFITGIFKLLENSELAMKIDYKSFDKNETISFLQNIAYMNFRISSGKDVKANRKIINEEVETFRGYLISQIELLNPEIMIVGGIDGVNAYNRLFNTNLKYNSTTILNEKIIVSIKHFSRANYQYYNAKSYEIFNKYNLIKMKTDYHDTPNA